MEDRRAPGAPRQAQDPSWLAREGELVGMGLWAVGSTTLAWLPDTRPTVSPLLPPIASHNLLLYQSLPNSIPYRQVNVRRRKDEPCVGTAARGSMERLSRLPRRLYADGASSGRVRRALSTRAGDRGQRAPRAPLPPGIAVRSESEECGEDRHLCRCRTPSHPRLHRHGVLGSSALGDRVSRTSGRPVGPTRWHYRFRSQ